MPPGLFLKRVNGDTCNQRSSHVLHFSHSDECLLILSQSILINRYLILHLIIGFSLRFTERAKCNIGAAGGRIVPTCLRQKVCKHPLATGPDISFTFDSENQPERVNG